LKRVIDNSDILFYGKSQAIVDSPKEKVTWRENFARKMTTQVYKEWISMHVVFDTTFPEDLFVVNFNSLNCRLQTSFVTHGSLDMEPPKFDRIYRSSWDGYESYAYDQKVNVRNSLKLDVLVFVYDLSLDLKQFLKYFKMLIHYYYIDVIKVKYPDLIFCNFGKENSPKKKKKITTFINKKTTQIF